jgi:dipeptidyl aminopeptidase/acylaminoacyl peptidase
MRAAIAGRSSFVIAFFCAGNASLHAADGGVPSNEDLRHVRALAEPQVSPDGGRVLIRVTDATADGGRQHLWLVDVGANTARQLTYSPAADKQGEREGRWLGDGSSILFLAKRAEHAQLFRLPMSGGEAHAYDLKVAPIVDDSEEPDAIPPKKPGDAPVKKEPLALDVANYDAAPDGRTIAILAQDPQTPGEKKQKDEKADALWVDHDKHRKRLYLLDAESGKVTPVEIPSDVAKVAWAKKSDRLIALAEGPNHAGDLGPAMTAWLVELANPSQAAQLKELPATVRGGTWSGDGSRFFFRAQAKADAPPGYDDLFELNLSDRSIRSVAMDLGGSLGNEDPVSAGPTLFQEVQRGFRTAYLNIGGTKTEELHFDLPVARALNCAVNNAPCAWLEESGAQAPALYFASQPGQGARLLNTPGLLPGKWDTPAVHAVRWKNEGLNIEGMLYLPAQASGGKVPLVVQVHGGPTGAYIDSFSPLAAHLLAQGWAVFMTNPRGSTGLWRRVRRRQQK